MAITLTTAFLNELTKGINQPDVIIELELDSGTVKYGYHSAFYDVRPILNNVSSLQNKIDAKSGYATRGQLTFVITGRDNFKSLIQNNYLKNRRINRKDGFLASGFAYSNYATTFTGKIKDWARKEDELTITVADDTYDVKQKIPVENVTKTQYLDYRNINPVDIMTDMLITQAGIGSAYVDSAKFTSEKDLWLSTWIFDRVITKPLAIQDYLNELQIETNSFILHDGEKITFKVFSPAMPVATEEWTDTNIIDNSFKMDSGYDNNFYNRILVYYDYDESDNDKEENFESALIAVDAASQDTTQWDEVSTKTIKSKWIRTQRFVRNSSNITGIVFYHASKANGLGTGTLVYNYTNQTLQYTAPGGTAGTAVKLSKDGKHQILDSDTSKYVRVLVTRASLPGSNQTDTVTISTLSGAAIAETLATKLLRRYRDPVATAAFEVDINDVSYNSQFIKPTDLKDVTTDEAVSKGSSSWSKERCMITSVRPDFSKHKVQIETIQTRLYYKYGFIAPAGYPDYPSASEDQRRYAYIGTAGTNLVNGGTVEGYRIW